MRSTQFLSGKLTDTIRGRDLGWLVAALIAVLVLAGWGLSKVAPPPPPKRVIMTTGAPDGAYHSYALRYRALLAEQGVDLELHPSSGAKENLQRLRTGEGGVEVGLVQGGLVQANDARDLVSLGSLFYEPIWVFYRGTSTIDRISELRGRRIAIGIPGSGTHELSQSVASDNGLAAPPTTLVQIGGLEAADALVEGKVDAAIYVSAIDGPAVQKLTRATGLRMMDMRRADAYVRRLPYLHKLDLPEGVIDLAADIPPQRVTLIALTGNLVAREDLHPVAVELLLQAAREVHGGPTLLNPANMFPAPIDVELPLDTDAERFYKERPSLLRRVLPFWVAVWAERLLFIMLPLLAVAIPTIAYLPKIYDWRIRSKLDGWYVEINRAERAALDASGDLLKQRERMNDIDERLNRVKVPKAYLSRLYTLRQHAAYVRRLLDARAARSPVA
jgi:TRAP transporter TAXI family solute receptor